MIRLAVEYITTADDPITGDAIVPGFGEEFFGLVRRLPGGQTVWRRISLAPLTSSSTSAPPAMSSERADRRRQDE